MSCLPRVCEIKASYTTEKYYLLSELALVSTLSSFDEALHEDSDIIRQFTEKKSAVGLYFLWDIENTDLQTFLDLLEEVLAWLESHSVDLSTIFLSIQCLISISTNDGTEQTATTTATTMINEEDMIQQLIAVFDNKNSSNNSDDNGNALLASKVNTVFIGASNSRNSTVALERAFDFIQTIHNQLNPKISQSTNPTNVISAESLSKHTRTIPFLLLAPYKEDFLGFDVPVSNDDVVLDTADAEDNVFQVLYHHPEQQQLSKVAENFLPLYSSLQLIQENTMVGSQDANTPMLKRDPLSFALLVSGGVLVLAILIHFILWK